MSVSGLIAVMVNSSQLPVCALVKFEKHKAAMRLKKKCFVFMVVDLEIEHSNYHPDFNFF
jgi:hypothetical protein